VPKISSVLDNVPKALDELIYRATSANPDERPRDAAAFFEELSALHPKKNQMSLELDIPIAPMRPKKEPKSLRKRVREMTAAIPVPKAQETTAQVEKRKKVSKRVKRNRFIALGLAIALGIFGWYALIGPGSRVVVPSTVGATQAEVRAALDPLGLTFVVAEKRFSEEIAADRVIASSPEGGGRIDQGGIVDLIISKGPERYAIPQLAGLTPKAATNLVKKLPFTSIDVTICFLSFSLL
jgi:serine/threonine-protein kinase